MHGCSSRRRAASSAAARRAAFSAASRSAVLRSAVSSAARGVHQGQTPRTDHSIQLLEAVQTSGCRHAAQARSANQHGWTWADELKELMLLSRFRKQEGEGDAHAAQLTETTVAPIPPTVGAATTTAEDAARQREEQRRVDAEQARRESEQQVRLIKDARARAAAERAAALGHVQRDQAFRKD
eukprot:gene15063-biopygen12627